MQRSENSFVAFLSSHPSGGSRDRTQVTMSLQQVLLLTESLCWPSFCPCLSVLLTQVRALQHSAKMQPNSSPIKVHLASGGTAQDCTGPQQGLHVRLWFSLFVQPCVEVVFFRNYSPHLGRIPVSTVLPSALAQEMTLLHHPRHLLNTC